jgi:ubiquinone/menaquinone biosynthesis C-methylase UbiE/predicted RNA-binding Zn-ribbon protein involved in translation (DUF1610 family)
LDKIRISNDISFPVRRYANFFHFVHHLAATPPHPYRQMWLQETGYLTTVEEIALSDFTQLMKRYPIDVKPPEKGHERFLQKPFTLFDDGSVWEEVQKWVDDSADYELIKRIFIVLENRFEKIWKREQPLLADWREELCQLISKEEKMVVFRCPKCNQPLAGWPPSVSCTSCSSQIPSQEGVWIFTDAPSVKDKGEQTYFGYDEVAEGYERCVYPPELQKQLVSRYGEAISSLIEEQAILLDLGCGPGAYSIEVAKHGKRVIAADISFNMLRILASHILALNRLQLLPCRMNAYNLPLEDDSLNAVMAFYLLDVAVGEPEKIVMEIQRVLKPNGLFITHGEQKGDQYGSGSDIPIRDYYNEELKKLGGKETRIRGWTSRESRQRLPGFFREVRTVKGDNLTFSYSHKAGWYFERLKARYTLFQIGIPEELHQKTIEHVDQRLTREFGAGWKELAIHCKQVNTLSVYVK